MCKINIIDIFNPTKLRDWLNALLEQGGGQGPKGDSVEYVRSNAVHDGSGGFTTVTITSKVENNIEQSSLFEVPDGKDGVAVIDAASAGYGLSVKDGKIELGRDEQGIQLVEPPANHGWTHNTRIEALEAKP